MKLRDIFSLDIYQSILPDGSRDRVLRMTYTELYINGHYRGLYGIKEILTPSAVNIGPEDALIKANAGFSFKSPNADDFYERLYPYLDVRQELPGGSIADAVINGIKRLEKNDASVLELIDTDSLIRYAIWVQLLSAEQNLSRNMIGIWRADAGRLFLSAYDTDLTFGFTWSPSNPPGYCIQDESLAEVDYLPDTTGIGRMIRLNPDNIKAAAELYFSLRESVLSEETLLARMNELFNLATDSGARARDHLRWPTSPTTDTAEEIETFIKRRLAWCDDYFQRVLDEASGTAS